MTDKMPRWTVPRLDDDMHTRLQRAALNLFRERGYDRTTAAEIARSIGATERTFFRYFHDKREVLFGGEALVRDALTGSIADAPADLGSIDILFRAFRTLVPALEGHRLLLKSRHEIIAATPALRERETAKSAGLADALAAALRARGVMELRAVLAARVGMAAFAHATLTWLDDPDVGLGERIERALWELRELFDDQDGRADRS